MSSHDKARQKQRARLTNKYLLSTEIGMCATKIETKDTMDIIKACLQIFLSNRPFAQDVLPNAGSSNRVIANLT